MQFFKKNTITFLMLLLVIVIGQPVKSNEPTDKELKKLRDKWLTVTSWTATYSESYNSLKTWELRPGVTMKTSIKSTISGSFTLDSQLTDAFSMSEWYGYGTGSSTMETVTSMTSSESGGEIVITETIKMKGSGQIGDPSKNEYGEYWGGSIGIDVYSGTYGVGFGSPDDEEPTLTRSVSGLPSDYSKLRDLPPGLREIFLPLGEKAEEWATYNGPLEDAQGLIGGGLTGMELFPDFDEPKEYPLPKSGMQLKGSYSGKNGTKSWSLSPRGKNKPLVLEKTEKDWIPNVKTKEPTTIKVTGNGWAGEKVRIRFTMYDVTYMEGFCLNSQDLSYELDLEFKQGPEFKNMIETGSGWRIETINKVMNTSIDIIPNDWGAWGKLKAEAQVDEEENIWYPILTKDGKKYITIPLDERGGKENKIADAFEEEHHLSENIATMQDDEGANGIGDGLTAYEEYRGLMIGGDGGKHITTNPEDTVDLFVHCESPTIRSHIPDGTVVGGELVIHMLDLESDYVSRGIRRINRNSSEWSRGAQRGIRLTTENIPDAGVVGWAVGRCTSPGTTDYVALDLGELSGKPNSEFQITIVHELMHGCGIKHHGAVNMTDTINGLGYSVALWNGVNAGDIGCVMQYGWGDLYLLANGTYAIDSTGHYALFQDTDDKIVWNYLCNTKQGSGPLKQKQLGQATVGACLKSLHVSDK